MSAVQCHEKGVRDKVMPLELASHGTYHEHSLFTPIREDASGKLERTKRITF